MSTHYYPDLRNCGSSASLAGSLGGGLQEVNSGSSLNNNRMSSFGSYGEIQHTGQVADQIGALYLSEECSDLTLIVEGERFPVHRVILAVRSVYFKAMLFGGMREATEREVTLGDTPVQPFKALLKYIYTGKLQLKPLKLELVLDMLTLVHKYGFSELEAAIPEYLKSILKTHNVCSIFTVAHLYSLDSLVTACLDFIDNCASDLLSSHSFLQLPASALIQLLGRNSFCAPELEIFWAIKQWIAANPDESDHFPALLAQVRLPLLKMNELYGPVRDSGLITADQILDAIKDQNTKRSSELNYRGFLFPGTNVATTLFGAKVITRDSRSSLLMVNKSSSVEAGAAAAVVVDPTDRTYTQHPITMNPRERDPGITIELGRPFILNNIKLHLPDRDQRNYSYYVEVSVDKVDWVRVIDHSHFVCRSRQNLLFEQRVVKFIRVVGTYCSVSNNFHLASIEAIYTTEPFEVDRVSTLQIPRTNVATTANNALVIEGVSRSRNALLNGIITDYNWDDGYTCHQLGSGALVVQLPQPYLIDTMRLLLWDCDDRWYSFYIEVSSDQVKWAKVAEVIECRSWQTVHFDRQPVVFVRIVGTYNSANEVFHCVHFECPAMESDAQGEEERLARLRRIITRTVDGSPPPTTQMLNKESARSASGGSGGGGLVMKAPSRLGDIGMPGDDSVDAAVEKIVAGIAEAEEGEAEERQNEHEKERREEEVVEEEEEEAVEEVRQQTPPAQFVGILEEQEEGGTASSRSGSEPPSHSDTTDEAEEGRESGGSMPPC